MTNTPENVEIKDLPYKGTPTATLMALAEKEWPGCYVYDDAPWTERLCTVYGLNFEQTDLFARHSSIEPGSDEWVQSVLVPNPKNFWLRVGEPPMTSFQLVDRKEVGRFETFLQGYALVAPGGDIAVPGVIHGDELKWKPDTDEDVIRMMADVSAHGKDRFRIISAIILKKGSDGYNTFVEQTAEAFANRHDRW